jgi:hypothetical protein
MRVTEYVDGAPLPAGTTAPGVAAEAVRLFGDELLARCRRRDEEVSRG